MIKSITKLCVLSLLSMLALPLMAEDDEVTRSSKLEKCILNKVCALSDTITGTPTITPPKLTIIMIMEDTAYNQFQYLKPYLSGGIGTLLNNGINYTNATYPEGNPSTGPGHTALATGALGQIHGIPYNNWFINGLEQFLADDYTALSGQSLIYVANTSNGNPPGQTYPRTITFGYGASNRNILADTLADQLIFYSTPQSRKQFYYVSLNNTASSNSFVLAGQLGKPFAFDTIAGGFTSTQAFYPSAIVTITDPNPAATGATATAVVVDGVITGIVVSNGGTGYTTPTVTITDVTTDRLIGITGIPPVSPPPTPVTYNGQVIGVLGSGTGATATATVVGGNITAINVTNGGSAYHGGLPDWVVAWNNAQNFPAITSWTHNLTYPTNSSAYNLPNISNFSAAPTPSIVSVPQPIVGGASGFPTSRVNGSGATAIATANAAGTITSVTLLTGGSGYTSTPAVAVSGLSYKGVPASITATMVGGVVTALTLVSGGSGYTNPVVVIEGVSVQTPYNNYTGSPDSINKTFDFIKTIIENNLSSSDELVIFFNIAVAVDTASQYGIQALDNIDMYYHVDQSFGNFISQVYQLVNPSQVLFGLTADEGSGGFLQYWNQAGNANALDLNETAIRTAINTAVSTATAGAITNLIPSNSFISVTDIWFGPQYFSASPANQAIALTTAQNTLLTFPGIKNVWTQAQLLNTFFQEPEEEMYIKLELFPIRSGQLKYSTQPLMGMFTTGANNEVRLMWEQVNHVPLVLYQPGQFEHLTIAEPVFINQLPTTLAQILGVPRPSGAPRVWGPLPGIFTNSVT